MTDIVAGMQNQTWIITKYDGNDVVWERRVPLDEANVSEITQRLSSLAKEHLTEREIQDSPDLYRVDKDVLNGKRVVFMAGENPHYTATLWRADELGAESNARP